MKSLVEYIMESRGIISSRVNVDIENLKKIIPNYETNEKIQKVIQELKDNATRDDAIADLFIDTLEAIKDKKINDKDALKVFKSIGFEKTSKTAFRQAVQRVSYKEYICLAINKSGSYTFIFNDHSEFFDVTINIRDNKVFINNTSRTFKSDFHYKEKYNKWLENISGLYVAKNSDIINYSLDSFLENNK